MRKSPKPIKLWQIRKNALITTANCLRQNIIGENGSVIDSENPHARRWRQMVYERRYNEIIDRMIAEERRESMALQQVIFPTVALFVSTMFVAIFKPTILDEFADYRKNNNGFAFRHRMYSSFQTLRKPDLNAILTVHEDIHDSILEDTEPTEKPYTKFTAIAFLIIGFFISLGIGLVVGNYLELVINASIPSIFSPTLKLEFIFYPPIFVLCVDIMHTLASKFEN